MEKNIVDFDTSITQQHGAGLFAYKSGYLKGVFHVGKYICFRPSCDVWICLLKALGIFRNKQLDLSLNIPSPKCLHVWSVLYLHPKVGEEMASRLTEGIPWKSWVFQGNLGSSEHIGWRGRCCMFHLGHLSCDVLLEKIWTRENKEPRRHGAAAKLKPIRIHGTDIFTYLHEW